MLEVLTGRSQTVINTLSASPKAPGNELLSLTTKVPGGLSFSILIAKI